MSERAAFGYGAALNDLLQINSRNRVRIGDATTVFWAEAVDGDEATAQAAETLFAMLADPPATGEQEEAKVADVLDNIAKGRPIEEVVPGIRPDTRFYVLGLSPNASRLSVRFWHADTIGALAGRIVEHWRDLRIEPRPWTTPPAIWRLLYETAAQRKRENIPPLLGGALTRAVLTGDRYPQSLPGSLKYRISPLDYHYDNLTVAGDWTACGFNAGCVEAATMSGLLAAHAIAGSPRLEEIIGYDHP